MRTGLATLALAVAAIAGGCNSSGSLGGSIGESYGLEFDYIEIRKQALSLIVEFIHELGGGEDKVLKLTVEGHLLIDAEAQVRIPMESGLVLEQETFHQVVRLERISGQGTRAWPPVESGRLVFGRLDFETEPVGSTNGSFDIVFANGYTMAGSFAGDITVVDLR